MELPEGLERSILQVIHNLATNLADGGDVHDVEIARKSKISLEDIRDWVRILNDKGFIELLYRIDGYGAWMTPKGRLALRLTEPISIFYSYSHKDERLREKLEEHLALLKRQGVISVWHDRRIVAGTEWANQIGEHLESARIILLLVSSSFLASDYCYGKEMERALERHDKGEAKVFPTILRPCDWHGAPFAKLQALPKDAKAVTLWANRDEAFTNVAEGIRKALEAMRGDV